MSWLDVKKEMTEEKGLDPAIADQIGEYVKLKGQYDDLPSLQDNLLHLQSFLWATLSWSGSEDLLKKLAQDPKLVNNKAAKEGLEDMKLLFDYSNVFGITSRVSLTSHVDVNAWTCQELLGNNHWPLPCGLQWSKKISLDLSLARGLDYYTGVIYEAVVEGSAPPAQTSANSAEGSTKVSKAKNADQDGEEEIDENQVGVGSIAAGGRYDNLVGMFSSGKDKIPCVGISFGVERIFSILQSKANENGVENRRGKEVDVYVMSVGDGLLAERMAVCKELWQAGLSVSQPSLSSHCLTTRVWCWFCVAPGFCALVCLWRLLGGTN